MTLKPVAIGDIHGRLDLLNAAVDRFPDRRFVLLGDYIDRGPESRACLARVRELVDEGRAVACMGNHDLFMIEAVLNGQHDDLWRRNGGDATIENYAPDNAALIGDAEWMRDTLKPWHIEGGVMFAHAMRPDPSGQDADAHLWGRPDNTPVYPLPEGVAVSIHGHTVMQYAVPVGLEDGTRLWFIDTGAVFTGRLCALDCETFTPSVVR